MESKPYRSKKKKPPGFKNPQGFLPKSKMPALLRWQKPEDSEQCSDLLSKLVGRDLECMVCMNQIGWRGKIWNCEQCRIPVHLTCIKRWKQSSGLQWNCPACNFEYTSDPLYTCFCGKVEDPVPQPMHPPHSCGEVCGRSRSNECPHLCPQQCHPGACSACTSMAPAQRCFCGRTSFQQMCKDKHLGRSCGEVCGKTRNCGRHACSATCHEEKCADCEVTSLQDCFCGKETLRVLCGQLPVCENLCNKILACGKHFCEKSCHDGGCGECRTSPSAVTHCPCGKNALDMILLYPRASCCDPIPSCYGVCSKVLNCGHKCAAICHAGECPPCKSTQTVSCRCTRTSAEIQCQDLGKELLCNKLCTTKKSCKRHKCNKYCCLGYDDSYSDEHRCLETCGKMLQCGLHTCLGHCHIGNCESCKVVTRVRVFCACGESFKDPPLRCGTRDMEIPCMQKCSKLLQCRHQCQSSCHFGECPPCSQLVEKPCKCGKMHLPMGCGIITVSCGKICMRPLDCGHLCTEKCHNGDCKEFTRPHLCGKKKGNCSHTCVRNCHLGEECPVEMCRVKVVNRCKCGNKNLNTLCGEVTALECDEGCTRISRDKALGSAEKETYTEELVEFAKNNVEFVKKVEERLQGIISRKERVTFFPPMKDKQRWFCHELAAFHYKLDVESLDREPYRSVYLYFTETARIPSPSLSRFVALVSQGIETEFEKKECLASLLFYQLSPSVTSEDITDVLQKFNGDFYVKWENDHSAFAHFFSISKCTEARKMLERTPGQYSIVKMIVNTPQEESNVVKKKSRNNRKAQEVTSFDDEIVPPKPMEQEKTEQPERLEKIIDEGQGALFSKLPKEDN